ncbi:SMI1/KNR4 family protein [Methylovulum psychrotolerans]|uniref:SMI1/KNR4 family protein n=1 Tax=Methylovulum psychrotolerans TaxID=1704499 RepID=A0A2S5CNM7_9GAMM|nr:SMI1/KNR4 family protein [Methylovulum psychrotolerans]POZ52420.1 SMI1/KNR4 family protein [Methylovulum psychrotolerans]
MSLGNKNWQMVMVIYLVSLWGCQENNSKNQLELKRKADNMTITHQHSGYTAGPNQWQAFLSCWYKAYQRRYQVLLSESPDYPELPILSKYGLEPAQQQVTGDINEAIDKLEMSLGTTLPKSYKDFLLAYQPPLFEPNVVYGWAAAIGLYAPVQVGRAGILEPELVGIYEEIAQKEKGSRYFCERLLRHPCRSISKNHATAYAFGCPSRPGHSLATQQGVAHMLSNDSTRFRIACIFTSASLRENSGTIASGDYSTPVSQRWSSWT